MDKKTAPVNTTVIPDEPFLPRGIMEANFSGKPKKLWFFLDDEREPPSRDDRHWCIFRTGEAMIAYIESFGLPDGISFDHDLGEGIMTGDDAAQRLVGLYMDDDLQVPVGFEYDVHSQNPIGAKNIYMTMTDLMRLSANDLWSN